MTLKYPITNTDRSYYFKKNNPHSTFYIYTYRLIAKEDNGIKYSTVPYQNLYITFTFTVLFIH